MNIERHQQLASIRRHLGRFVLKPLKQLLTLLLRTIAASCVFYMGVAVALHLLGYPVPRVSDLGRYLEGLTQLAKVLS